MGWRQDAGQAGPLAGIRVIELVGMGPGPFAAMLLGDLGADVLCVDRPGGPEGAISPELDPTRRNRRSVCVDLKRPNADELILRLVESTDALIDVFRPGVAERLGIGPDECLARNPRLVYGRMTGWGQGGPLAADAGHDINYVAVSGSLDLIGRRGEAPVPPLNLLGDYAGGGMLLTIGVLAALANASRSGRGQVVDAAMVDGASLLTTYIHGLRAVGAWQDRRGMNLIDTGAPFYNVYQTADGKHVAVGALEARFYRNLLNRLGIDDVDPADQMDQTTWPAMTIRLAEIFRSRTRDEWCALFEGADACVTPVLALGEVASHPHHRHRGSFTQVDGVLQPAPAPRFSQTPTSIRRPPPRRGQHTDEVLLDWGLQAEEIVAARRQGVIGS
ncbi:CaiB/BaiF CoA transferase family protein [Mycobacterium sp. pUA109]|uniref:CaiB/BaiF CoA transferase family protein n=1 Tax=Mycobacterium sp. pUA109 TaxID=3238982 RepID=UPI00351ABB3E